MNLVLVADTYPPNKTSGAIQLCDLAVELVRQGHQVTVLVGSQDIRSNCIDDWQFGVRVIRLRVLKTRGVGHVRRAFGEAVSPFLMLYALRVSGIEINKWDGVIWYSPTIFLGPVVKKIKKMSSCKGYLIIRDIFPEWLLDLGLISLGPAYFFFRAIARFQYLQADTIGIQSPGNAKYFRFNEGEIDSRIQILNNWLSYSSIEPCSISVKDTALVKRKIIVYAGNMGIAQKVDFLIEVADGMQNHLDIGFLFVGRGECVGFLKHMAWSRKMQNILFFDEIDPSEIPGLYEQCTVGLLALHPAHKTNNIPGKFISYMRAGLPVAAIVNRGNDIVDIINTESVGFVSTNYSVPDFINQLESLIYKVALDDEVALRCRHLHNKMFSSENAAKVIVKELS